VYCGGVPRLSDRVDFPRWWTRHGLSAEWFRSL